MPSKKFIYKITDFNWSKELNTFFGDMNSLWEASGEYDYSFPSGRSQFEIHNEKTGGFRRFVFKYETAEERHYCTEIHTGETYWDTLRCMVFESEDGIICKIYE